MYLEIKDSLDNHLSKFSIDSETLSKYGYKKFDIHKEGQIYETDIKQPFGLSEFIPLPEIKTSRGIHGFSELNCVYLISVFFPVGIGTRFANFVIDELRNHFNYGDVYEENDIYTHVYERSSGNKFNGAEWSKITLTIQTKTLTKTNRV